MRTEYFITMDTHCRTTDACVKTRHGKLVKRVHVATTIPQLREVIESVPRPRYLAFEEGSLAGWLSRNLRPAADELIVCDPRRNAYVAKDGDKDDPIDAEKLNDLYRGGFLKAVHQLDSEQKAARKQIVGLYHDRVGRRVAETCAVLALGKRWGVMLTCRMLADAQAAEEIEQRLSAQSVPAEIRASVRMLLGNVERCLEEEQRLYEQVCQITQADEMMRRTAELPGYGPVRSATLVSYLDTPWRFKSKSALWKYVGIGLKRERSGDGPPIICVEQACNRLLRNVVIGAAQNAIDQKENVFARRYARWIRSGLSPKNARRNVARDQVTAIWGMWKTGRAFDPGLIADPDGE